MAKRPKIIAVDFDGTLHKGKYPSIGPENKGPMAYIKWQKKQGAKIILWTCRRGKELDDAVEWCKNRGLIFDAVNENLPEVIEAFGGDTRKVVADEYLDDKNIFI